MTRMGLDEWEEKHGVGSTVTSIPAGDFLNADKVAELEGEKLRRKYKRKAGKTEEFSLDDSEATGHHRVSRATAESEIKSSGGNGNGGVKLAFTRVQWASRINKFWAETHDAAVQGIFLIGENLIIAKEQLSGDEWELMLKDLRFGVRTVQRFIAVAKDQRLRLKSSLLPAAWGTLNELTKLGDSELDKLASEGILRPEMERHEVETFRKGLRLETGSGAASASASAKRTPKLSDNRTVSPVRPDYSATAVEHDARKVEPIEPDARAVLGQIVALIDLSADAPAIETLAAVRKLASDALVQG